MLTHGLRSRERITMDEEINSLMKMYEADEKRLNSIMRKYKEQKTDLSK